MTCRVLNSWETSFLRVPGLRNSLEGRDRRPNCTGALWFSLSFILLLSDMKKIQLQWLSLKTDLRSGQFSAAQIYEISKDFRFRQRHDLQDTNRSPASNNEIMFDFLASSRLFSPYGFVRSVVHFWSIRARNSIWISMRRTIQSPKYDFVPEIRSKL